MSATARSGEVEDTWRRVLAQTPAWTPPAKRTVVVVPHPDDEVLGAGGLIAYQRRRSVEVRVVAVSDGEAAYPDAEQLGSRRIVEQEQALDRLGVPGDCIVRLGLPDSRLEHHQANLTDVLAEIVDTDTLLVAPWRFDVHPDHEACGEAAGQVAAGMGVELVSSLFWAWYARPVASMPLGSMVRLELDKALVAARSEALACHGTQLVHDAGSPVLTADVLGPLTRSFEAYVR